MSLVYSLQNSRERQFQTLELSNVIHNGGPLSQCAWETEEQFQDSAAWGIITVAVMRRVMMIIRARSVRAFGVADSAQIRVRHARPGSNLLPHSLL
ncbi:hypothetical protein RRG08_000129 [Elysia crispata]|uniref:Uncharacterized protein n=1 Tax=Elysia crispata TaxID=231223 RepID=A0AAE0YUU7_9GAST|nr:hypothetical protein RRG08_000129 [Elysia crispata]